MKQAYPRLGLARLCRLFGVSRQAYYQQLWSISDTRTEAQTVLKLVAEIRQHQPRLGTRKLYHLLQEQLLNQQIKMGRDALFDLLAAHQLLVRRRKCRPQTTFSRHRFSKFTNLVVNFIPLSAHQLWVADITYIPLSRGFSYLSLITDAYSRKIVGYYLADNLSAHSSLLALQMALAQLPAEHELIHHSDRGIQYCSYAYVKLLEDNHIQISMSQQADPYENALAERVNGILKQELLQASYANIKQASAEVDKAIVIYNQKRPHMSIDLQIPHQAHLQKGKQNKLWKSESRPFKNNS